MRVAAWAMVLVLALFPWWAIPLTAALVPLAWDQAAQAVLATLAAIWTPFVLLAALLIAGAARKRTQEGE
jgi:hypothetical protein